VLLGGPSYRHAPVEDRRTIDRLSPKQRAYNRPQAGLRALVEPSITHLANARALRRRRAHLPLPLAASSPHMRPPLGKLP
jgi:hypothetical protein